MENALLCCIKELMFLLGFAVSWAQPTFPCLRPLCFHFSPPGWSWSTSSHSCLLQFSLVSTHTFSGWPFLTSLPKIASPACFLLNSFEPYLPIFFFIAIITTWSYSDSLSHRFHEDKDLVCYIYLYKQCLPCWRCSKKTFLR